MTTIEDITYNYNEKSVTNTRTGEQVKLPGTQATTFEMLINADDYIATKKEICQRLWTINEKDVNNRYNALAWRLRESLAQINGIELLTIKDCARSVACHNIFPYLLLCKATQGSKCND